MSEKLKPCPFCGGISAIWSFSGRRDTTKYSPYCTTPGCLLNTLLDVDFDSRLDAVAAWNTREAK